MTDLEIAVAAEAAILGVNCEALSCGCVVYVHSYDHDHNWFLVSSVLQGCNRHGGVAMEHHISKFFNSIWGCWVTKNGDAVPGDDLGISHILQTKKLRGYP